MVMGPVLSGFKHDFIAPNVKTSTLDTKILIKLEKFMKDSN